MIQTYAPAANAMSRHPPTTPPITGPMAKASCALIASSEAFGMAGLGNGGRGGGGEGAEITSGNSVFVTCTALALEIVIALTDSGAVLRLGKSSNSPALLLTLAATF